MTRASTSRCIWLVPNFDLTRQFGTTITFLLVLSTIHPFFFSDDLPCRGLFLLHQGIQRRIRITIVHDQAAELKWRDVRELVVGRIRNTPESDEDEDNDNSVLSLGLFPGDYLEIPGEDRNMFRFEAAWDSSLHNSALLNRVTSPGEQIFMTISAYLEVSDCGW